MTYNTAPRVGDALRRTPYTANTDAECAPPGQHEQPGLLAEQLTAVVQDIITTQHRSARQRGAAGLPAHRRGDPDRLGVGHQACAHGAVGIHLERPGTDLYLPLE